MEVRALEGINLRVGEGERLGIVGNNGAGKSTLLKLLAGIYPPTTGRREVHGRISSLFEISTGFESDATGWENIAYRGYLQGETPRSIREKVKPIAEFSELGEFLDMPVRYYSTGMMIRLAFSIATAVEPEILIIDEVLAAGDAAFQVKARDRMRNLIARARAVIVVSHDMKAIARLVRPRDLDRSRPDPPGRSGRRGDRGLHQPTRPGKAPSRLAGAASGGGRGHGARGAMPHLRIQRRYERR